MGRFVNPDNKGFQAAVNSEIYVNKTGLLSYTNKVMDTNNCFICNSRPRRFGKSITAHMLAAYYSRGCDSERLFRNRAIGREESFRKYLNQCDVIYFDVQWCCTAAGSAEDTVSYIAEQITGELKDSCGEMPEAEGKTLPELLSRINARTGRKFVIIIDEWDALIRDEAENTEIQEEYINFLRGLFKGSGPVEFLHLAYITGILPVKKLKTQSALNNFEEFTMLGAGPLTPYIGFTEDEVLKLCREYGMEYGEVKRWYDGYILDWVPGAGAKTGTKAVLERLHVYNPFAAAGVMRRGIFESYWSRTGTYDSIVPLIGRNFDGLRADIIKMISRASVPVNIGTFQNDMVSFANKDDVLTVLIHLGYLAYDRACQRAFIPNEEIRTEFLNAVKKNTWDELQELQQESEKLLHAALELEGKAVAQGIEKIHDRFIPAIQYNNENSLSSVLTLAFLSAMQYYMKPIREFPTGKGFADFVYLPKPEYLGGMPALLVELKWDKDAGTAIAQIKNRHYVDTLKDYTGDILLVGISYRKKTKRHHCVIERVKYV